jgi:enoyl-CoA hydratase/carnithine racemase
LDDRVVLHVADHVADVMLNRADKYNAIDMRMFAALGEAADRIAADSMVRAVVLRGAGDNFCAGIDVSVLSESNVDFGALLFSPVTPSSANVFQRAAYAWRELDVPVICAMTGVTFGGGLQIALGADVRFAARDAQVSIMESKWGLIPDMAISTTLRDIVAADHVKELAWSGRVLDAAEALRLGLVTSVVNDAPAAAKELARACAARSPQAIQGIKRLVNQAWRLSDDRALALEAELQSDIIGSTNQVEAVRAILQNRAPVFKD